MNDDLEERIAVMENRLLALEASSEYQVQAVGVLLALIEYVAEKSPLVVTQTEEIRRAYSRMIREETEKRLASISDDAPNLATKLRDILKESLENDA